MSYPVRARGSASGSRRANEGTRKAGDGYVDALFAGFWAFVGGASLLVGALLGLYAGASQRVISVMMAVGAGVLISSVSFELMEEA